MAHHGRDPIDGHEILAVVAVDPQRRHEQIARRGPARDLAGHRMGKLQRGVKTVVGRRVSGLRIADDDRRTVDRGRVEKIGRADEHLGLELRLFVDIAGRLAEVDVAFQDAAFPQAADIGRRYVVELPDARAAAEFQHPPRAFHVRKVRLAVGIVAAEDEAGGVVKDRRAVPLDPVQRAIVQTEIDFAEIAFQHDRPGQRGFQRQFPLPQQGLDALPRRFRLGRPNEHGHAASGQQTIAEQIGAQEPRGTGKKVIACVVFSSCTQRKSLRSVSCPPSSTEY